MAKEKEELGGTSLEEGKKGNEEEIDKFIKEALEESKKEEEEEKSAKGAEPAAAEEKVEAAPQGEIILRATPIRKEAAQLPEKEPEKRETSYEKTFKKYSAGDIISGTVVKIDPSGVLIDIGYKAEGLILPDELSETPFRDPGEVVKIGDKIEVWIERLENKEGYVVLSKKRAPQEKKWKATYDAYRQKKVLEAKVTSAVKGGLVVDYEGIRGFIPASQIAKKPETPLDEFVGKMIAIKVIEINRRQGKIVFSHKLAAGEAQRFEADKLFNDLEVGQIKKGAVTSIKNFGAFVDIGGIEGLIHITELSWKRVNHPSEVLKIGDKIDVFVLGVDKDSRKIALGLKELQPDPWVSANELYKAGDIVKGKVVRLVNFGAFIELEKGLEGLCHISELSTKPVQRPEDILKVSDEVSVKILRVLPEEQKIGLSIRE
ncbi:MAG: 30S ribosomal protein S1, partial [Candidatus Saganbacteria bacterium]|nr:30S ribosomal protein S1 [Candidatus Saganbacteria bacterium]